MLRPGMRELSPRDAMYSKFEPKAPSCAITCWRVPRPMASMTITEATPMMMPSRVKPVRKRLIHSTRQAARAASSNSVPSDAPVSCAARDMSSGGRAVDVAGIGTAPESSTISPSLISITRRAWAATLRSCVIRMMVWPASASSPKRAMTSAPLLLSSAPVGSSARMMRPPFIKARAIDTRCCCPPDNWFGR